MFDSVIDPRSRGRFGSGAVISVLLHVVALVVALVVSARSHVPPEPAPVLKFMQAIPGPAAPAATGPTHTAASASHPSVTRPHRVRAPNEAVVGARIQPPDLLAPDASGASLDVPDAVGPGVAAQVPGAVGEGPGTGVGQGPVAFSAEQGMTMPRRISGADPKYTREALEAGVQGMLIARCVITAEGAVTSCQIVKGLPHLDRAVLEALQAQRYTPVLVHGQPVAVSYLFTFRMVLPDR